MANGQDCEVEWDGRSYSVVLVADLGNKRAVVDVENALVFFAGATPDRRAIREAIQEVSGRPHSYRFKKF
jgi:hypothetical protein